MPAYNFQPRFREPIESGRKRHTIRAKRARQTKPGERLSLYTGMRSKLCRLIVEVECTRVQEITIQPFGPSTVIIDGEILDASEKERLAIADGFDSFADMMRFWTGRLPFHGEIIHWRPL
jgi:hypothetical protein